jgi:mono/diheme cytochrome c family protein
MLMMLKILKWIGIVVGSLMGLLLVAFLGLYAVGTAKWSRMHGSHEVPAESIIVPTDAASVARGDHLASILICRECHTDSLGGQVDIAPGIITLSVPNLTSGAGGVGATNTDEDWVRAIRHGVGNDGRGLVLMPAQRFYYIGDADLGALIAFLKTLPPQDNHLPPTDLGPIGRLMIALDQLPPEVLPNVLMIDHDAARPVAPEPAVNAEYGRYLAVICTACHGDTLNGRTLREGGEVYIALNLTPGGELAAWSEEDFFAAMRTGLTPSGRVLNVRMPWKYLGQMTDDELRAVWIYLQSLPPLPQGE